MITIENKGFMILSAISFQPSIKFILVENRHRHFTHPGNSKVILICQRHQTLP